jgi:hypothetical protein
MGNGASKTEVEERICKLLVRLVDNLEKRGCSLIGHIKASFEVADGGCLFFNVTTFNQKPRCRGTLNGAVKKGIFTLNVIVFGVDLHDVTELVKNELDSLELHNKGYARGDGKV